MSVGDTGTIRPIEPSGHPSTVPIEQKEFQGPKGEEESGSKAQVPK